MSAISTLAEAHLFGRDVGAVEDVDGVHMRNGHLVDLPHEHQDAPRSVRAGLGIGLEKATAAVKNSHVSGGHAAWLRQMVTYHVGSPGLQRPFPWRFPWRAKC